MVDSVGVFQFYLFLVFIFIDGFENVCIVVVGVLGVVFFGVYLNFIGIGLIDSQGVDGLQRCVFEYRFLFDVVVVGVLDIV